MINYTSNEVGHSQVYALEEDSRGYIWIGTWGGGLTQFDGQNFYTFSEKDSLLSIYITSLHEDQNSNIWIGSKEGLSKFDGRNFQHFSPIENQNIQVNDIIQDSSGRFWIGTDKGLFHFDGQTFTNVSNTYSIAQSPIIHSCYADNQGNIWVGSNQGAFYFGDKKMSHFTEDNGLTRNNIVDIIQDGNGNIWLATDSGGINIFDGNEITRFTGSDDLEEGLGINSLYRDATNHIWIGMGNQGIYLWHPTDSVFTNLRERNQDGLESDNIKTIFQDSWGDYWFGTSGGGLSKYYFSDQQFTNYSEIDGLNDKEVYAISRDTSGRLWLATSRGVSIYDKKTFYPYSENYDFVNVKVRTIFADRQGRIWIGTEGKGLALYDGISHRYFKSWDGIGGDLIQDITQDSAGNIWIAMADAGIARLATDQRDSTGNSYLITRFGQAAGVPASNIYDLHIDQKERVWFATRTHGIGYFENDSTIVNFDRADGLPASEVRTLTEDNLGNLWGGTANAGIFKLNIYDDSLYFQTFNQQQQLSSNNIYLMAFDPSGKLWLGNQAGVDQVEMNTSHTEILKVTPFRAAEGFRGGETCESAVLVDTTGAIWFGTIGGLTLYTPGSNRENRIEPLLHFTNIQLSYDSLRNTAYADWSDQWGGLKDSLVLPYDENNISFEFLAIDHMAPNKVTYSWMLEGMNDDWSPPQKEHKASYTNLSPGFYTFKVKAYNEDQTVTKDPIQLEFTIKPPVWQTWWFRLAAIALGVLSILLFFRARIQKIRRKAKQESEKLEMEKNLLELEQKALQLQMNPHFIFNALNTIQSLINEKDHKKARYQLAKFSKLMRATLENSRATMIPLEDEIQSLENYLAIEQLSRNHSFDFKIIHEGDLDSEALLIPPMMIQPFVENAIIHGVAHISEQGNILVDFSRKNGKLECTIVDNGIGREQAKKIKSQVEHGHKSTALQVTQERLDILNKGSKKRKSLEMLDVLNEAGKVVGTKVVLRLPLVFD